jgi:hypothetical protein
LVEEFKTITQFPPQLIYGIKPNIPVEVLPVPQLAFKTLANIYRFVSRLTNILAVFAVSIRAVF